MWLTALQCDGARVAAVAKTCGSREGGSTGVGREDVMEEEILTRSLEGGDDCQDIKGRAFQEERKVWTEPLRCEPM